MKKTIVILFLIVSMLSCNYFKNKSINGTYVGQEGYTLSLFKEMVFKDDKLILDSFFTKIALDYEIKDNNIYVKNPQYPMVIEIIDDNTLKIEDCIFKKTK
jgi:hypothetical protein